MSKPLEGVSRASCSSDAIKVSQSCRSDLVIASTLSNLDAAAVPVFTFCARVETGAPLINATSRATADVCLVAFFIKDKGFYVYISLYQPHVPVLHLRAYGAGFNVAQLRSSLLP